MAEEQTGNAGQENQGAPAADNNGAQPQAAANVNQGGGSGDHSDAFKHAANNIHAAIGSLDGNTFDTGDGTGSSFFNEGSDGNSGQEGNQGGENNSGSEGGQQVSPQGQEGVQSSGDGSEGGDAGTKNQAATGENAQEEQNQAGDGQGESNEVSSPLFDIKEKPEEGQEQNENAFTFESAEDFDKFFESGDFGGITRENIATKLPEVMETLKAAQEQAGKATNYEAVFNKMPKPIYEAIVAWNKGEDWRQPVISHDPVDYSKDFASQDPKAMVNKFSPGKVTEDDWEEYKDADGDEAIKAKVDQYLDIAEQKYALAHQTQKDNIASYEKAAQEQQQVLQASFDASRAQIFKSFEGTPLSNLKEATVGEVDNSLKTQQAVLLEFFNQDGTLREDAHTKMAMAKYAKDLVISQAKAIEKRAVSAARAEVIGDTAENVAVKRSGGKTTPNDRQKSEEKVRNHVENILGGTTENLF